MLTLDYQPSIDLRRTLESRMHSRDAVLRMAQGDMSEATFEAALPELARLVRSYLLRSGVRRENIEDLAQEACIRVYKYRGRRRGQDLPSLKWWLRTICRRVAIDHRSEEARPVEHDPAATPGWQEPGELQQALRRCIALLPEPDATVLRIRAELQWSSTQIAQLFGWRRRNCERVLARARDALAQCLRKHGYEV